MASYAITLSAVLSTISVSALIAGGANKLAPPPAAADPLKGLALAVPATEVVLPNGLTPAAHKDHSPPLEGGIPRACR